MKFTEKWMEGITLRKPTIPQKDKSLMFSLINEH